MPQLAANLTMMFNGVDFLFPYDYDKNVIKQKLTEHKLSQVLHNLPAGNWAGGERGIGCHPDRVAEFENGVDKAIDYATTLGCKQVNCLAGIRPPHCDPNDARETFIRNLQFAAIRLKAAGIKLLIEPIN